MKMIDATPKWSGVFVLLVEVARNGETMMARKAARDELGRMSGLKQFEVLELVEAAMQGITHEVRATAMKRFGEYAARMDEANERAKKKEQGGNDGE